MRDEKHAQAPDQITIALGEYLALEKVLGAAIDLLARNDGDTVARLQERINHYRAKVGALEPREYYGTKEDAKERERRKRRAREKRERLKGEIRAL